MRDNRLKDLTEDDLKHFEELFNKAHDYIGQLSKGTRKWTLSIPVRPEYDDDIVFTDALLSAETLLDEVRKLQRSKAMMIGAAEWLIEVLREKLLEKNPREEAESRAVTDRTVEYSFSSEVSLGDTKKDSEDMLAPSTKKNRKQGFVPKGAEIPVETIPLETFVKYKAECPLVSEGQCDFKVSALHDGAALKTIRKHIKGSHNIGNS